MLTPQQSFIIINIGIVIGIDKNDPALLPVSLFCASIT